MTGRESTDTATVAELDERSAARSPAALDLAVGAAIVVTLFGGLVLLAQPVEPRRLFAFLVALAWVCVALLATRRAPSLAWVGAIGASYAAFTIVSEPARSLSPGAADVGAWLIVATAACVCAIVTAGIAARYATRPGCRLDPAARPVAVGLVTWLVVACVSTIGVVLAGQRTPDPAFTWVDVATLPTVLFLPLVLTLAGLGVAADVRAARDRARDRLEIAPGHGSRVSLWQTAVATARELVPGQAAAEEAAQAAERTRLAGDLHAAVLPALRRAIADAEAGGDPEDLARHLRMVDLELERLMADRWPVVLEAFGLVAALEDLAERLEADGAPPVAIDIEDGGERPPATVERAAWRFAEVALDNAVRHAAPTAIAVTVAVDAANVSVAVTDDGSGFDPTSARRPRARGLTDATRRAADVGAVVRFGPAPAGGTVAAFEWTRPGG